jgi:hypothetical protein
MTKRPRTPVLRQLDNARQKAKADAERAAIRDKYADYQPANVRTYGTSPTGFDYDAAIQAAAYYSVPPSGLPRNTDTALRGKGR